MCGRYVVNYSTEDLQSAFFFTEFSEIRLTPRYNVAPTTQIPVVRRTEGGVRELTMMRWGLIPSWAKPGAKLPLMINARSESIATKPAYRSAFKKRRCLIPASGYYEWQATPVGKKPFYIGPSDCYPMALAGVWETSRNSAGEEVTSAAIVTTASTGHLAAIHERMPVFVRFRWWERWLAPEPLSPEEVATFFAGVVPYQLHTTAVRPLVNSIRNDGWELLVPAEPEKPPLPPERDLFG